MAKKKLGVRAKAKRRVQNAVNRLSKNGYVFNQSFIEKIHNPKTHFEKIDIDKIYSESTKGGIKGTKARAQERSERARRAARTRKEKAQRGAYTKLYAIDATRGVLEELNSRQFMVGYEITDTTTQRFSLLSFFDRIVSSINSEEEMNKYGGYLESVGERIMQEVNSANNAFYWEDLMENYSTIMTLLKGSALTVDESLKAESFYSDSSASYYEEDEEGEEEDFSASRKDLYPTGYIKSESGQSIPLLYDPSARPRGVYYRGDTYAQLEVTVDENHRFHYTDMETGEVIS